VSLFVRANALQLLLVFPADVLYVAQPVVDQTKSVVTQRSADTAAPIVTANDDVLNLEYVDSELQHRQAIEIGVHDDICDVAVHEHLTWREADDLVGGNTAVRASNP